MNEMYTFPMLVGFIVGTALLSSVVTASLPYVPMWWNAFKSNIKRVFSTRATTPKQNVYCDDLQAQIDNLADKVSTRERNMKGNIRRYVREYLEELKK